MNASSLPTAAAAIAVAVLPFNAGAAGLVLLAGALGCIVQADYGLRQDRVRLPRRQPAAAHPRFQRFAVVRATERMGSRGSRRPAPVPRMTASRSATGDTFALLPPASLP